MAHDKFTPDDFDNESTDPEPVTPDEATFDRDEETGEIEGEWIYLPELAVNKDDAEVGAAKARPLNKAARRKYLEPLLDGNDISDERLAELYERYIIKPDLPGDSYDEDRVTKDFVTNDLDPKMEDGFYMAVLLASGEEKIVEILRKAERGELDESDLPDQPASDAEGN